MWRFEQSVDGLIEQAFFQANNWQGFLGKLKNLISFFFFDELRKQEFKQYGYLHLNLIRLDVGALPVVSDILLNSKSNMGKIADKLCCNSYFSLSQITLYLSTNTTEHKQLINFKFLLVSKVTQKLLLWSSSRSVLQ